MTLPFDLTLPGAVWLVFTLLGAAYVRGYSGFGFAALVVASASLVTNPLLVVPVVLISDLAMSAVQARDVWRKIDWRRTGGLFAGALIGVPLGIWALSSITEDAARMVISLYVLAMCALLSLGFSFRKPVGHTGHAAVGVLSGMANAAAVGGLPVAVFFAAQPLPAAVFRATLVAYFTLLDLWSVPLMWSAGMISGDTVIGFAVALPVTCLGVWLGGRHFTRAKPESFRRFAIGLLVLLAGSGLIKAAF